MSSAFFLIFLAVFLSACALAAFIWSLCARQYEDLPGASERVLYNDDDYPIQPL